MYQQMNAVLFYHVKFTKADSEKTSYATTQSTVNHPAPAFATNTV